MKTKNIRILTAGCSRFRDPILLNKQQAEKFGYDITIYDLGDLNIEGAIKHDIDSHEFKQKGRYHRVAGVGYSAKSLHKGEIVADCIEQHPDDYIAYMDGDAVMTDEIGETIGLMGGADVGVTVRDPDDMRRSLSKKTEWKQFLGTFNAGIIVFAPTDGAKKFVKEWCKNIDKEQSDQKALNMLINPQLNEVKPGDKIQKNGVDFICLDGAIYNWGYFPQLPDDDVKILHMKGLRFRNRMDIVSSICRKQPMLPLRGWESDFEGFVDDIDWEPHSISNVEAYYWWAMIAKYKPDVVLESGICKGRSTHVIAGACKMYGIPYHICIDNSREHEEYIREKFKDYNIDLRYGQKSHVAMENIIAKIRKYRTLAFIDGPKDYKNSMKLYAQLKQLNLVGMGVHDCNEPGGCAKALADARAKYWPRADMLITNKKSNGDLYRFNQSIESELEAAYRNTKDHWSKKIGKEMTYDDYVTYMSQAGLCFIEGK